MIDDYLKGNWRWKRATVNMCFVTAFIAALFRCELVCLISLLLRSKDTKRQAEL